MVFRSIFTVISCFVLMGCPSNGDKKPIDAGADSPIPVKDTDVADDSDVTSDSNQDSTSSQDTTQPNEEVSTPDPCAINATASLEAGSWKGSTFTAFNAGNSPDIDFGAQGGTMISLDLLAKGTSSTATNLEITLTSKDGAQTYTKSTQKNVEFTCQKDLGQLALDLIVEVDGVPGNEAVLLLLSGEFTDSEGAPTTVESSVEITLEY